VTASTALVTVALNEMDVVTMPNDNRPNPMTLVHTSLYVTSTKLYAYRVDILLALF